MAVGEHAWVLRVMFIPALVMAALLHLLDRRR